MCRLAHEAHHRGDLPATATPGSIAELAALFIRSIGTHTEEPGGAAADGESGAARLARLWGITQPGMADRESG